MPSLRLLADDLTGALDTAVELVGLCGPIEVGRGDALPPALPACFAIDSGTRERSAADAAAVVGALAPLLEGADIAFKKVDSLFRGPWVAELTACLRSGVWRHCVVAPAFPHHGRHTREGRQVLYAGQGGWRDLSGDLVSRLSAEGLPAVKTELGGDAHRVGGALADGLNVFDAHTDADLDAIVDFVLETATGPVLWYGTGGLAQALARAGDVRISPISHRAERSSTPTHPVPYSRRLSSPVLGLFGSDQAITIAQIEACAPHWITVSGSGDAPGVADRLAQNGVAMVSVDLPFGLDRDDAAKRIGAAFSGIVKTLPAPGTLIVAGGETLRGLCSALEVAALNVNGQVAPGLPRSTIIGGPWDGVTVISKSGAFGGPSLWRELLRENGLMIGGDET